MTIASCSGAPRSKAPSPKVSYPSLANIFLPFSSFSCLINPLLGIWLGVLDSFV